MNIEATVHSRSWKGLIGFIMLYSCSIITLWLFNIAMENPPFLIGKPR
jgi:hypothetical protein